jgi:AraC-like DNA-binding protein
VSVAATSKGRPIVDIVSTATDEDADPLDAWPDFVRRTCGMLQVIVEPGFADGTIATTTLGDIRLAVISADPHTVIRQRKFVNDDQGHIYVATPVRGSCLVRQDDIEVLIRPGDIATFDSSRPYSLEMHEPFELISVRTRHETVGLHERNTRLVTGALWGGSGVGALACDILTSIGRLMSDLDDSISESLGSTLTGVVSTLFAERLSAAVAEPAAGRQLMLLRILRFAERRLNDPTLSPAYLARRYNVSLRYLQLLFAEQETSPARWIRDERLARIRADLRNPRLGHLSVAALGERWGLIGASQVSRLFRLKYGLTPSDFRRGAELAYAD